MVFLELAFIASERSPSAQQWLTQSRDATIQTMASTSARGTLAMVGAFPHQASCRRKQCVLVPGRPCIAYAVDVQPPRQRCASAQSTHAPDNCAGV